MIWRDAAYAGAARVAAMVAGLASSILTARLLGPEGRGELYLAIMLAALASQFGSVGLHAANTWMVAREQALLARLAGNSLWVALGAGVVAAGIATGAAAVIRNGGIDSMVLAGVIVLTPLQLLILLLGNLLVGVGTIGSYARLQVGAACAGLCAAAGAFLLGATAANVLWLMAGFNLLVAVGAFRAVTTVAPIRLRFDRALFASCVRYAARAFLVGLFGFLVTRASVFVLGLTSDREQVGYFSVASQLFDVLVTLPASMAVVLLPKLVRIDAGWTDTVRIAIIVGGVLAVVAAVLWAIAPWLVNALFGPAFAASVPVLRAVLPAAVLYAATSILSQYPAAHGMPPAIIWTWVGAVPVAWGCAWLLAPAAGAVGAGIAMSVTYGLVTVAVLIVGNATQRRVGVSAPGSAPR